MLTSGPTPLGTSGDGAVTLITMPAARWFNYLRITNEGAYPGWFSLNGGTIQGRIPAGALGVPAVIEIFWEL